MGFGNLKLINHWFTTLFIYLLSGLENCKKKCVYCAGLRKMERYLPTLLLRHHSPQDDQLHLVSVMKALVTFLSIRVVVHLFGPFITFL